MTNYITTRNELSEEWLYDESVLSLLVVGLTQSVRWFLFIDSGVKALHAILETVERLMREKDVDRLNMICDGQSTLVTVPRAFW